MERSQAWINGRGLCEFENVLNIFWSVWKVKILYLAWNCSLLTDCSGLVIAAKHMCHDKMQSLQHLSASVHAAFSNSGICWAKCKQIQYVHIMELITSKRSHPVRKNFQKQLQFSQFVNEEQCKLQTKLSQMVNQSTMKNSSTVQDIHQ